MSKSLTITEFVTASTAIFEMPWPTVTLRTRRLREAGMLPARPGGRKVSINAGQATSILLAVLGAETGASAAAAVQRLQACECVDAWGTGTLGEVITGWIAIAMEGMRPLEICTKRLIVHRNAPIARIIDDDGRDWMFRDPAYIGHPAVQVTAAIRVSEIFRIVRGPAAASAAAKAA